MSEFIRSVAQLYSGQLMRYRNRPFLRAAMAGCALVAMANGSVSLRERMRVDRIMETLDALKVFDPHEGVVLFNEFVEALRDDPAEGRRRALEVITREVADEPEKAGLLARICLAVSERDGAIAPEQRREVADLCRCIGVAPGFCPAEEDGEGRTASSLG